MRWKHWRHSATALLLVVTAIGVSCGRDSISDPGVDAAEQLRLTQVLASEQARIAQEQQRNQLVYQTLAKGRQTTTTTTTAVENPNLIYCAAQPYDAETKIIGPKGGELQVGRHRLKIPEGALKEYTVITAEAPSSTLVSVNLSPHGLQFAKPVTLRLDYDHCSRTPPNKKVVQLDDQLKILEYQRSDDYEEYEYITGWLNHFSKYGMAEN